MNELQIFKNELFEVAVKLENDEVVFEAEVTAKSLGFTQVKNGKPYIRWDRVNGYLAEVGFPHQVGKGDFIPESIVYLLAFKGETKLAVEFQKWLAIEVIPSIRKHGAYMTEETIEKALTSPDFLIQLATNLKKEKEGRLEAERKILEQQPKVIFADAVSASKTSILIGDLAKLLKQNGYNTGQKRLFEKLREKGYLIKRKSSDYNSPTQRAMELGLFEVKETAVTHSDGHVSISKTTKVTGKGQQYFINKFLNKLDQDSEVS